MKRFINDICDELAIAIEQALYNWDSDASILYKVACGVVKVSMNDNDDMTIDVIHNNGNIRKHSALKAAIENKMYSWYDVKDSIIH